MPIDVVVEVGLSSTTRTDKEGKKWCPFLLHINVDNKLHMEAHYKFNGESVFTLTVQYIECR